MQIAVMVANAPESTSTSTAALAALGGCVDRHHPGTTENEAVDSLRRQIRQLLSADREGAVLLVNEVLAEHQATPRLVRHDDLDWHVHAVPDGAPALTRIAVEAAMAMIEVIRDDQMSRLGRCADAHCDGVVLDLSRNRSRRFCSTLCGNRFAVSAYRARRSSVA